MSNLLGRSVSDYFSWETLEKLPKSGEGTDVFFLGGNPNKIKMYDTWHIKSKAQSPHTLRFRFLRAICDKDINEVKLVLQKGYNKDAFEIEDKYGYNAMGLAAALNRVGILEYLIMRGFNVNQQDKYGNTPLMHAVINWQFDSIRLLVQEGAKIDIKDKYGFTAQEKAKMRGLSSIVTFLDTISQDKKSENINFSQSNHLPGFHLQFDFESKLTDKNTQLTTNKQYYLFSPLVYPFNDLTGLYYISLTNKL